VKTVEQKKILFSIVREGCPGWCWETMAEKIGGKGEKVSFEHGMKQ